MQIAVTGANGFVGRHLMQTLMASNTPAIGLIRGTAAPDCPFKPMAVDYRDTKALAAQLKGSHTLIHLVGKAHGQGGNRWEDFRAVNVDLSLKIAKAAQKAGVKRFIFVSSVKALGEATAPGAPLTNATMPNPVDHYGRSKLLAERSLRQLFQANKTELIIVRPPLVWGESPKGNLAAILRWARIGLPLPLAGIENRRHWVSINRLCDFLVYLATHRSTFGELPPLLLSDDHALSTPAAIEQMLKAHNVNCRLVPLPRALWQILSKIPVLAGPVQKLIGSLEVDANDSWARTGWHPSSSQAGTATGGNP